MSVVSLPTIPEGQYLEDYIAACLQCGGFYTEKSLIESGETQVMELDIMAWKPADGTPQHELFEIKGGKWGFPDIFKVYGWKTYLQHRGVNSAFMLVPRGGRSNNIVEYIQYKCREIGLTLIVFDDLSTLEANLGVLGLAPRSMNQLDHSIWRFSFWLERQMQRVVTISRRSQSNANGPDMIYRYQELIRNGFLQAQDVRQRLWSLYKTHFDHPRLARSVAAELDGSDWDIDDPPAGSHWTNALYYCKHPLVQSALYYEHRAKLDILKGAVEFALLERHGTLPPVRTFTFLGIEISGDFLPSSFYDAVRMLQRIDGFERIPILWQSFMWKWGGFFVVDHESDERAALADEIGIAEASMDDAMSVYDVLFPMTKSWFQETQGVKMLKLFPCQFRGIGARYRCLRLGATDLNEAFGSMSYQYLIGNMNRWNNAAVDLLEYGRS